MSAPPDARAKSADEILRTLSELFPKTFAAESWHEHRPLKVGIDKDLVAAGVLTPGERKVLSRYVGRRQYQVALAAGGPRVDLDGNVAGEVTPEQIEIARASLAELDRRQVADIAAAKAARQAERDRRKAEAAALDRAAHKVAQRAAGKAAERPKGPAPYHRATLPKPAPAPPQPVGDGLSALKRAAQERKAREVQP